MKHPKAASLWVSTKAFNRQMQWIADRGYTTVTMDAVSALFHPQTGTASLVGNFKLPAKPVVVTFDDGYSDTYDNAFPLLLSRKQKGVFYVLPGFAGQPGYITADQMRKMSGSGMDIGSHTVDHKPLRRLGPLTRVWELTESRRMLEEILGKPVRHVCYPYGDYNRFVEMDAQEAGYLTGTTTQRRVATKEWDSFALPRISVRERTDLRRILP